MEIDRTNPRVDCEFWKSKRVLVTGHTGFKGSWLVLYLRLMGAYVCGMSNGPPTSPSLFEVAKVGDGIKDENVDVRDKSRVEEIIRHFQPDVVLHLAAQPIVKVSYRDPLGTLQTNVMGTANILEAVRVVDSVRSIVVVTTDKVYENREWLWGYREEDRLGGHDPYAASKACAEIISASYRNAFFCSSKTAVATARAGNVVGGGDWGANRIVVDLLRAFSKGERAYIRSPSAIRPWQHVLDPLSGYLMLAEQLFLKGQEFAESWNFGPWPTESWTVEEVVRVISAEWGDNASWTVETTEVNGDHETNTLKVDISKAVNRLHWKPRFAIRETLQSAVIWHKAWVGSCDMRRFSLMQIEKYIQE